EFILCAQGSQRERGCECATGKQIASCAGMGWVENGRLPVLVFSLAYVGCATKGHFADRIAAPEWGDFAERVQSFTKLVDGAEKILPPLPDKADATQIASHRKALSEAIRKQRTTAKRGGIFHDGVRENFVRILRSETRRREGTAAKRTI